MPLLIYSKRHGRVSCAISYEENPRPTFSLSTELLRLPISDAEAALGLAELQRLNSWVEPGEAPAKTPALSSTAAQPAAVPPSLAPTPSGIAHGPQRASVGSGADAEPDESWMWNLTVPTP